MILSVEMSIEFLPAKFSRFDPAFKSRLPLLRPLGFAPPEVAAAAAAAAVAAVATAATLAAALIAK